MFILFNNLIIGQYKKALYNALWFSLSGSFIYCLLKQVSLFKLSESELIGVAIFLIPSIFLSLYVIFQKRTETSGTFPSERNENEKVEYHVPENIAKSGLGPLWVNVMQEGFVPVSGIISFLVSFIIAPVYLLSILFLYVNDYNDLTSSLFKPLGILNIGIFAIQSRIVLADYTNGGYMGKSLTWIKRLKLKKERELFIMVDLLFIVLATSFYLTSWSVVLKYILFFYGFRLIRIVLLIPYFEDIWASISRGIKLSANYVISFLVILFVLSISSRMLFSSENENFNSLISSVYTNFQIVLGNGFELAANSQKILLYVFLVTILIGIIFTSAITALITDSLLEKSKGKETNDTSLKWYKREKDELSMNFYLRAILHITRT
jgi:hypothetical protein